jgi:lysophospholipase L1-like esterase
VAGTGAYASTVTWSVSLASAGTISAAGLFTAGSTVGTATITATSTQDTTKSGSEKIVISLGSQPSSSTPLLAAGLQRVVSTYAGPAMRIQRLSDNTQTDIYFTASGNVDTSAILSFLGSTSTLGYVVTLYDQTGNGYNLTQTTVANAPTIQINAPTSITANGVTYLTARSIITSDATEFPVAGPGYWNIPTALATNFNSTTTIEAYEPDYSGGEGWEEYNIGNSDTTAVDLLRSFNGAYGVINSGGAYLYYGSGYYWRQQPTVVAMATSPTAPVELYVDGVGYTGGANLPSIVLSGGTLLGGAKSLYISYSNFLSFELYNSTLTQSQVQTISSSLIPRSHPTVNIVGDGDSITEGHCATYGRAALRYAEPSLSLPADITNIALGGTTTSNPINNSSLPTVGASHYATLYQPGYGTNILYLAIGTNDIHVNNATGAATWANVETVLQNAKSIGYKTAVASIMHEAGETTAQGNEVNNFNALLYAAVGGPLVDSLVDYAANPDLSSGTYYPTYSCDGTHPDDAGYAVMGTIAAAALNKLIP